MHLRVNMVATSPCLACVCTQYHVKRPLLKALLCGEALAPSCEQVCRPSAGSGSAAGAQDDAGRYYTEQDLAVGAILTIHQRQFELLNADEFTFQVSIHPGDLQMHPAACTQRISVAAVQADLP